MFDHIYDHIYLRDSVNILKIIPDKMNNFQRNTEKINGLFR